MSSNAELPEFRIVSNFPAWSDRSLHPLKHPSNEDFRRNFRKIVPTALSSKLRVSRGEKLGSTQTRRRRARVERLHLLLTTPYHRQPEERDTAPGAGFLYYIYQAKRMDFTLFVPAFPIPRNSISEDSTRNRVTRARPNFKSIPLCPIGQFDIVPIDAIPFLKMLKPVSKLFHAHRVENYRSALRNDPARREFVKRERDDFLSFFKNRLKILFRSHGFNHHPHTFIPPWFL